MQSSNWNVAKPYTTELILKWLVKIDDYRTLSIFGYSDIYADTFMKDDNLKNTARLNALKRLINSIISLIRTTKFAIKKNDRETFDTYRTRLLKIEKYLPNLRLEKKRGRKIVELNIMEEIFEKIIGELDKMIDDINLKLNDSSLIFTATEEYDPKKIKESLKEKYINRN
ncbi:hypothetical protein LCGC14_1406560 [marine sediment metagenome]|uniref:Uncharacterized protein n=1 Tax=marine sediment metagenome TaxID=412755 RepID=A0A0F9KGH5_9ZZZZ